MTDPKQPSRTTVDPKAAAKAKADEKKVFIRNNTKTPYVVPGGKSGATTTIRPERVTPVDAEAWQTFTGTPFGKSLLEAEAVEESSEDEHTNQPKSEQEQAAEEDAAQEEAARARQKKGRK
jgi:RPA family protein